MSLKLHIVKVYLTVASLLYVILGFKFAGRLDNILNKKMAQSTEETDDIGKRRLKEKREEKKKRTEKGVRDVFTKLKK